MGFVRVNWHVLLAERSAPFFGGGGFGMSRQQFDSPLSLGIRPGDVDNLGAPILADP